MKQARSSASRSSYPHSERAVEELQRACAMLRTHGDRVRKLMHAALREIFDEAAYARFLTRNQLHPSRASYAAFRNEHDLSQARKPRCC